MTEEKNMTAGTPQTFRMDVPTAVRNALKGVGIALGLVVLIIGLKLYSISSLIVFVPLVVGSFYTRDLYQKIQPSYVDAAGGGAVAAAIFVMLGFVGVLLLSGLFLDLIGGGLSEFGSLSSLLGLGAGLAGFAALGELPGLVFRGALMGAIGGAWIVLLRTQQIK